MPPRKAQVEKFIQFLKSSKGGQPLPVGFVSLNRLNNLYFAAFSVHFPRGGHVEVSVAEDGRGNASKLAIQPVSTKTVNSYSVISSGSTERTAITIAALVRAYNIPQMQYRAAWDAKEKMLVIEIKELKA
ncbi:MAG: hypothetical protein UY48_C0013G0039 [Candidatus Gottesmanbacteria bacterium GW2011_GWB1_49_7]|uniref:Uncharacterized protein n=1 Tax=Candidatus Gottesmanbacteria bacterium GW2011_GWB1_49_7 TaxID=1618448 RepID=A0A0G1VZ57_9BACT|nr:MAG: hypothetical protein UY48_C0013G0039 [Candidatus Gottesmanbacteria bacterium GW2011_GWB1_49_7]